MAIMISFCYILIKRIFLNIIKKFKKVDDHLVTMAIVIFFYDIIIQRFF